MALIPAQSLLRPIRWEDAQFKTILCEFQASFVRESVSEENLLRFSSLARPDSEKWTQGANDTFKLC